MSRPAANLRVLLVLVAALAAGTCGSSTPVAPPPPPPPAENLAPVVRSVEIADTRVEVGAAVTVRAVVEDAETAADQLRYEWTATLGEFSGEGREVTWRAPAEIEEPQSVTLNVTVIETYVRNGAELTNRTTFEAATAMRVHDSVGELTDMVRRFLDDFIDDSESPSRVVRNFSDSCPGKQSELEDVEAVREGFTMLPASRYSIRSVTVVAPWQTAEMTARCDFVSREKTSGVEDTARGTCSFTGLYEDDRWWMCTSHFAGTTTNPALMIR